MLQELSAGSCSASCCSLARGTTDQGDTSGLVCLGVGLPVLGSEEGLERLCRTDRMGFGLCGEAEGPGLLQLLKMRPMSHLSAALRVVSGNPRVSKAGKDLGHHQVQSVP